MSNLTFGTPQVLILSSVFMYSQNFWLAISMFALGLFGALAVYSIKHSVEQEKAKKMKESVDKVEGNLKSIFSMALQDNNETTH